MHIQQLSHWSALYITIGPWIQCTVMLCIKIQKKYKRNTNTNKRIKQLKMHIQQLSHCSALCITIGPCLQCTVMLCIKIQKKYKQTKKQIQIKELKNKQIQIQQLSHCAALCITHAFSALRCTEVHCIILQCKNCGVSFSTALYLNALYFNALYFNALDFIAVYFNAL